MTSICFADKIYESKDKEGTVIFSDEPIPGKSSKEITIKPSTPPSKTKSQPLQQLLEKNKDLDAKFKKEQAEKEKIMEQIYEQRAKVELAENNYRDVQNQLNSMKKQLHERYLDGGSKEINYYNDKIFLLEQSVAERKLELEKAKQKLKVLKVKLRNLPPEI